MNLAVKLNAMFIIDLVGLRSSLSDGVGQYFVRPHRLRNRAKGEPWTGRITGGFDCFRLLPSLNTSTNQFRHRQDTLLRCVRVFAFTPSYSPVLFFNCYES